MNSKERHEARYQRRKAAREAKRREKLGIYDDFDRLSSVPALLHANFEARKGVMFKASVARYNMNFLHNAVRQSRELRSGKDIRQPYYTFTVIERGKTRSIHSLHYAERVIRRSVCTNTLVPVLSHNLIYDNGASLKGKGVTFSANRCAAHLHQYYREYGTNEGYCLIIDFKGFFDHILHEPLKQQIDKAFTDKRVVNLSCGFIDASNVDKRAELHGMGLYIGPEDSQIYAVSYPNSIDHWLKDRLGLRYYARYMDDSYILCRNKKQLQEIRDALFVEYEKLGIIPNPKKTQIVKLSKGFSYLKTRYFLTETGRLIRKPDHTSIVRERRKLKKQHRLFVQGVMTMQQVTQSYMSWRGSMASRDAHDSVESVDRLYFELFGTRPWRNKKKRSTSNGKH